MEILRNMFRRKLRTFLTIFGIVIGVFALVVMGGMAEKMNLLFKGGTRYLENSISFSPKGTTGGFFAMSVYPASVADEVKKIKGVEVVTYGVGLLFDENPDMVNMSMPDIITGMVVEQQKKAMKYMDPDLRLSFADGDWWTDGDSGVAVLGVDLAKKKNVEVGDTLTNRGMKFKVVGVVNRTMTAPDSTMYIPLEDARKLLEKTQPILKYSQNKNYLNSSYAVAKKEVANEVAERIKNEIPDLTVISPKEAIDSMNQGAAIFSMMTMGSTLIALVVGGLSVINTMLMSVSERTREIGVKKAVGAGNFDILKEYILESGIIGVFAGLIGLGLGSGFIYGINAMTSKTGNSVFTLTPRLAVGAVAFAVFIGVFAGLYPAYRAAKLDPIIALKSE